MYRSLQIVGVLWMCYNAVYLLHPSTGPFDYDAGALHPEWTGGLIAGAIGGLVAGVVVYRRSRKAHASAAARGLGPEAAKAEFASAFGDGLIVAWAACSGWGFMLHVAATPVVVAAGVPYQVWLRFAPLFFLAGSVVGVVLHYARKGGARRA